MPKPKRSAPNRTREHRIAEEIVVDACSSDERAMSWYYYLEGKLDFPVKAKCVAKRAVSPLRRGEAVDVLGMAPEEDCTGGMLVLVRFAGAGSGCRSSSSLRSAPTATRARRPRIGVTGQRWETSSERRVSRMRSSRVAAGPAPSAHDAS